MTSRASRHLSLPLGALVALGVAALLTACERRLPTSAEIEAMDVKGAEQMTKRVQLASRQAHCDYFVDGVQVPYEAARDLPGNVILSIRTTFSESHDSVWTRILTDGTRARDTLYDATERRRIGALVRADMMAVRGRDPRIPPRDHFLPVDGIVIIDGVRSTSAELAALDLQRVSEIEAIKGRAAMRESKDPAAAQGIVRITTRR